MAVSHAHVSPWWLGLTGTAVLSRPPESHKVARPPFLYPKPSLIPTPQAAQTMPRGPKKREVKASVDERIPRPVNCFMIFRADWLRNSNANSTPGNHSRQRQKDVSQEAAAAWNNLSPTLKQLYKVQADIVKEEHSRKYPGWVYQPRIGRKKRSRVVDDAPHNSSPTKRVARGRMTAPYQKPSVNASGKRNAMATPPPQITTPAEPVWDDAWFSGSSSMRDPFYSTPLQPLAPVSVLSRGHSVNVAHLVAQSYTDPQHMAQSHPQFFLPSAQKHGFGMAPTPATMPFMYHPGSGGDGLRNPERRGSDALILASNALDLSPFCPLPQTTNLAEPVSSGPRIALPNSTECSTPASGSSIAEAPAPGSEAEPPTQALVESSDLSYDKLLEGYYNNNGWELDPVFNQDFNPFPMMGL
jgi:hypothetical protein